MNSSPRNVSRGVLRMIAIRRVMKYDGRCSTHPRRRMLSIPAVHFDAAGDPPPPLIKLETMNLAFPDDIDKKVVLSSVDLTIRNPVEHGGGHALLGRNGSGKTLLAQTIMRKGIVDQGMSIAGSRIQHVSFESHQQLLQEGGTVYHALSKGLLNKAAQFLVVRFGLYPLLHQDVRTLSNGQIKKVLIVRALSMKPSLLILDNAFDGLDVPSRQMLKELVGKTLQGFKNDRILVQAVSVKNTAHTQVLLLTHRHEEIVDDVNTISFVDSRTKHVKTFSRNGLTSEVVLQKALGKVVGNDAGHVMLPSEEDIKEWWGDRISVSERPAIQMKNVTIEKNGKRLIKKLNWTVRHGERWLVGGYNGAGKSTLSRLLAHKEEGTNIHADEMSVLGDGHGESTVGWVSTELHMKTARSDVLVRELLKDCKGETVYQIAKWLGVDHLLDLPFNKVSQGEQRLTLIAAAFANRPSLVILDEPCQGLDLISREHVLSFIERACQYTDLALIYITHHLEECLPSISRVLHLKAGEVVFDGLVRDYKPNELEALGTNPVPRVFD